MKKIAIIASLCLMLFCFAGKASAQFLPDVPDMKRKFVFGGNIGGGMYGDYLSLSLAPQIGYRIISPWEVGTRVIYDLNCRFDRVNGSVYGHYFGGAIHQFPSIQRIVSSCRGRGDVRLCSK